jgi:hypothetical protein
MSNSSTSCGEGGILPFLIGFKGSFFKFPKTLTSQLVASDIKANRGMFVAQSLHHRAEKAITKRFAVNSLSAFVASALSVYVCFLAENFYFLNGSSRFSMYLFFGIAFRL